MDVEFSWPIGMPLVRSLGNAPHGRIARVLFAWSETEEGQWFGVEAKEEIGRRPPRMLPWPIIRSALGALSHHHREFRQFLEQRAHLRHSRDRRQHGHRDFQFRTSLPERRHQRAVKPVAGCSPPGSAARREIPAPSIARDGRARPDPADPPGRRPGNLRVVLQHVRQVRLS